MSTMFYLVARIGLAALLSFIIFLQFFDWPTSATARLLDSNDTFASTVLLIVPLYLIVLPLVAIWVLKDARIFWWILIGGLVILLVFTAGFFFLSLAESLSGQTDEIGEVVVNFFGSFGSELFQAMLIASAVVFIERLVNKLRPEQQSSA